MACVITRLEKGNPEIARLAALAEKQQGELLSAKPLGGPVEGLRVAEGIPADPGLEPRDLVGETEAHGLIEDDGVLGRCKVEMPCSAMNRTVLSWSKFLLGGD
jgi:hypothetical protein